MQMSITLIAFALIGLVAAFPIPKSFVLNCVNGVDGYTGNTGSITFATFNTSSASVFFVW